MRHPSAIYLILLSFLSQAHCRRPSPCGNANEPISERWAERSDAEVQQRVTRALSCGRARGTRVLLEFTAPWCADCRAMSALEEQPEVASVLDAQYERVRINVRRWDAHRVLSERYQVRAIATYVVLDPHTQAVLAKSTREPVTGSDGTLTAAQWAAWLRAPTGH